MSIRHRIDHEGKRVLVIDLRLRNRSTGKKERYRRDARTQTKARALAQEREVIAFHATHGTIMPLLAPTPTPAKPTTTDVTAKTWDDAVTRYRETHAVTLKHSTRVGYDSMLDSPAFASWTSIPLASIDAPMLAVWDARLATDGAGNSHRRNHLVIARVVLTCARKAGYIAALPEFPRAPKVGRSEVSTADPEDVAAILGESDANVLPHLAADRAAARVAFALAAYAGLRSGEVRALRWSDVDPKLGHIIIRHSVSHGQEGTPKSGHQRRIPLARPLAKILKAEQAKPHKTESFVAPRSDGSQWGQYGLLQALHRTCSRLGITPFKFHALRHYFVTSLFDRGVGARVVMELAGHSDLAVTTRYAHASEQAKAAAVATF